ncbi:hypothetical protein DHEL01_v204149 [Diaporthe helianthi]|uniref:Uncharacterized protein n=1 Tax=Diaporthe helianthi TaxID=158607 RepID=A0A2P5I4M7_DIAHE|nr:hypothetical protein DHEL01_v204149 [Diaporthe helianthi]
MFRTSQMPLKHVAYGNVGVPLLRIDFNSGPCHVPSALMRLVNYYVPALAWTAFKGQHYTSKAPEVLPAHSGELATTYEVPIPVGSDDNGWESIALGRTSKQPESLASLVTIQPRPDLCQDHSLYEALKIMKREPAAFVTVSDAYSAVSEDGRA